MSAICYLLFSSFIIRVVKKQAEEIVAKNVPFVRRIVQSVYLIGREYRGHGGCCGPDK